MLHFFVNCRLLRPFTALLYKDLFTTFQCLSLGVCHQNRRVKKGVVGFFHTYERAQQRVTMSCESVTHIHRKDMNQYVDGFNKHVPEGIASPSGIMLIYLCPFFITNQ